MSLLAALKVALSMDTVQFEAGAKRAQRTARTTSSSIAKSLGSIKAIGTGFAAAFSVGVLASGIKAALDYAGSLGEVSQQLGVTTRDLQTFRFAAGQVGVDQAQLETGLQKLTITLGKVAAGAKAPTEALKAIGISAKDVAGISTGDAFRKIADGLQKIGDRSQRAAVEVALFGKSGAQLDNLLAGGSKALNELAAAADELGIVLSDKQIQQADDTADKLEAVKTVLAANIASVVADNANSIVGLAQSLGQLTGQIIRFLNSNPQLALGIIGAMAGGRIGGAYGAIVGAGAGIYAGTRMRENRDDANMDLRFRKERLNAARSRYADAKKSGSRLVVVAGIPQRVGDLKDATAELQKQTKLANAAVAASKNKPAPIATGNVGNFLAGGGGGGGGKPKKDNSAAEAERARQKALRDAFQFDQDQRRGQMDILRAQESLAVNTDDRVKLQSQILDLERQGEQAELDYQVASGEITKEQAATLAAQKDKRVALEKQALAEEAAAQKREDEDRMIETRFQIQRDALEAQRDLAQNYKDRQQLSLEILDLEYEEKKQALERTIANKQLTDAVRARAQAELDAMPAQYQRERQGVMNSNAGPLDAARLQFGDITDEMEQLKVDGIMGAVDALTQLTNGFGSFKDAAISAIKQVIAEFIRLQLLKMAFSLFSSGFGGGGGGLGGLGGGLGPIASSNVGGGVNMGLLGSAASGGFKLPGFATGGGFNIVGNRGVDRNIMAINGIPIAKVSHGERVSVSNDNPGRGGIYAPVSVSGDVSNPRQTGMQIAAGLRAKIGQSNRRGF